MKNRKKHLRKTKIGQPPGTLIHVGVERDHDVQISIYDYDSKTIEYFEIDDLDLVLKKAKQDSSTTWININGIHDIDLVKSIGKKFCLDPLILEDIVNTDQEPKTEDHQDYIFVINKMLTPNNSRGVQSVEHFCLVLGKTFLLTFQEEKGDVLEPIRKRLQKESSRIRKHPGDYLAYAIIDTIVDNYVISIENMRLEMEELEDSVLTSPETNISDILHQNRREMIKLRRIIWPMRKSLGSILSLDSPLILEETSKYFRDTHDHLNGFAEYLENNRELLSSLRDINSTNISNRMNEIMKVLTIIATIFIPLTFLAGIYGMNFQHMPELALPWAYPVLWVVMIFIVAGMVIFFLRKKWL